MVSKDEFMKILEGQLRTLADKVAEMNAKSNQLTADVKKTYAEQMKVVISKKDSLFGKINELSQATGPAADELVNGAEKALQDFKSAVEKASEKFKNQP